MADPATPASAAVPVRSGSPRPGRVPTGSGRAARVVPVSRWNAANLLTGVRFLLVVPFALVTFAGGGHSVGWRVVAAVVFLLASSTDKVDGHVARRYDMVTDLGKFADPLADKLLTGTALVSLSLLGDLWWWLTVVILVREIAVTVIRSAVARISVIAASAGGKAKTVLLTAGITLLLVPVGGPVRVAGVIALLAAAVVSTVTGVDYARRADRLVRSARSAG